MLVISWTMGDMWYNKCTKYMTYLTASWKVILWYVGGFIGIFYVHVYVHNNRLWLCCCVQNNYKIDIFCWRCKIKSAIRAYTPKRYVKNILSLFVLEWVIPSPHAKTLYFSIDSNTSKIQYRPKLPDSPKTDQKLSVRDKVKVILSLDTKNRYIYIYIYGIFSFRFSNIFFCFTFCVSGVKMWRTYGLTWILYMIMTNMFIIVFLSCLIINIQFIKIDDQFISTSWHTIRCFWKYTKCCNKNKLKTT